VRYYLINQDNEEVVLDITDARKIAHNYYEYDVVSEEYKNTLKIKKLANKFYLSEDGKTWRKVSALHLDKTMAHKSQSYNVYRGFKPSGLFSGDAGTLITQMPGKVVKIQVAVGDQVQKGQTLLILEAMKMENEIKAGIDGKIKSIQVKEGQALDSGHMMMEIE
jgi:biotin carboxyl carrier protein